MKIKGIAITLAIGLLVTAIPHTYSCELAGEQIVKKVFPNGMRVMIKEREDTDQVILLAMIGTGSANENEENNGVSHFLEHMIFRGTDRIEEYGLFKEIGKVGGQANAFTSFEMTGYFTLVPKENFDLGLRLLTESLLNPAFEPEAIEKERSVILEELAMAREDTPTGELFTVLLENAFPNHPYGKHVVGTRETVNSIDREMISSYYNGYYAPNNAIFVIMGGVDSEKVLPKVYESFKDWGKKGIPERELPTIRIENRKEVAKTREGIKEAYLSIGYVVPGCDKSSQYPLELLSFILGSGKSSRLYQALVVEGLASSVYAGMSGTKGQQLLTITATCDQEDIPKVEKAIKKEIRSLAKKGVTEDELKKARNTYKASLAMSAQNLMNDAVTVAMYETLHKMGPEEYLAKLDSITAKEVQKAAKDNLNKGYVIVSLTPGGNK